MVGRLAVLLLAVFGASAAADDPGSRPRNLTVSFSGDTVVLTSLGSNFITQASGTPLTLTHIDVGARSFGVVFLDPETIVVTHPDATSLSVLTRTSQVFQFDRSIELGARFRYSTEIISVPASATRVLVANRGLPPTGTTSAQTWCNAVYEVDVATAQIVRTFVTEREPSALAVSADATRLFVGHIQGSLGGAHLAANDSHADNTGQIGFIGDGGSILMFDLGDASSVVRPLAGKRIGVGSPVRGIAASANGDGSYAIYFTSVGDNANGEDPEAGAGVDLFGGRNIANVVSALHYDAAHVLQDIEHAVFDHRPDWTFDTSFTPMDGLPAVLPEKIVVRDYDDGTRHRELIVTHSGSGTVSRAWLLNDGRFDLEGSTGPLRRVRVSRNPDQTLTITEDAPAFPLFRRVMDGATNVGYVDASRPGQPRFTSNARALAYAPSLDRAFVATALDNELLQIEFAAGQAVIAARYPICDPIGSIDERNFFGFGRGFLFREGDLAFRIDDNRPRVGNQTCSTCHVDGHSDGKVRMTRRAGINKPAPVPLRKAVTVPSCFDIANTEWIFFEGLKTVHDGVFDEDTECNYCDDSAFFDNTEGFTNTLASPKSPHNSSGTLAASEKRGRFLFESMNCSRCHAGPRQTFQRTLEPDMPHGVSAFGPAIPALTQFNRFLHDPTQVFISGVDTPDDNLALRNMTDVGTRPPGDARKNGVNTPSLAGLWDNRPYFHDGRYRDLAEVLSHTWVDDDDALRAAPLGILTENPDNAFDGTIDPLADGEGKNLTQFGTHAPTRPLPWVPVSATLSSADYRDLEAFLLALSSETDPCAGVASDFIQDLMVSPSLKATWRTAVPAECEVTWSGPVPHTTITPRGSSHESVIVANGSGNYTVTVTAQVRSICGEIYTASASIQADPVTGTTAPAIQTSLGTARPNPFNPDVTIEYSLARDAHVSLIVYDAAGRRVRTLVDGHRKRDRYQAQWNGRDDRGNVVTSGVYFCRMTSGTFQSTRKLVLLK